MSAVAVNVELTRSRWDALRMASAVGIGTLVMLRATVFFAPRLVFDVDPIVDPNPIVGLGPAGSMAIDSLLWMFAAIGLTAEVFSGRKVDLLLLLLGLGGLPIVLWHGYDDLGNLWHGVNWAAAIMATVTAAHLARDRTLRVVMLALVAAAIAAVLVRGLAQMFYEHAQTVTEYKKHRAEFLAAQGWEDGSPQALLYENRLTQNNPIGWFVTTNVLGTFAASAMALWIGLALGLRRNFGGRASLGLIACLVAFFGIAAFELSRTDSKGALLAGALGLGIVAIAQGIVALRKRWQLSATSARRLGVIGGAMMVGLVLLAAGAIAVRGTMLPEHAFGDKSLLFRWFYMKGSLGILHEHWLAGIGPDKFQEQFVHFRPPRCPEEVTSSHNVLLDWAVSLGALGWTWILLLLVMAWRAGARLLTQNDEPPEVDDATNPNKARLWLFVISAAVMIGLGASFVVEAPDIVTLPDQLWRGAGIVAALLVGLVTMRCAALVSSAALSIALAAAAGVVLVHCQVEMTMTQPASVGLAIMIIALAAPASAGSRRTIAVFVSALLIALAGWLLVRGVRPAWQQQQLMIEAARDLAPLARNAHPTAQEVVNARTQSARVLRNAFDVLPTNPDPPFAAAKQLKLAADAVEGEQRAAFLREAIGMAELSLGTVSMPSYHALMAQLYTMLGRTTGEESAWLEAMSNAQQLTELDLGSISSWRLYGDICYEWHRDALAAQAYERVLENNTNMELDPLKQLSAPELAEVERRLKESRAKADSSDRKATGG